ncbi:vitronectin b [Hippocampus comes]|uniref:vitronectin b n=1 Tax=Hippocampus comes TaxID=109280 RepID=UPI00094E6C33|nr:PREDICTED: vitronectin-like [Hippocampus comes]XP_019752183.1 PREDICTED: vitronectin-like [Hippocampus comes]
MARRSAVSPSVLGAPRPLSTRTATGHSSLPLLQTHFVTSPRLAATSCRLVAAMKTLRIFIIAMMMMMTTKLTSAADETCAGRCGSFEPLRKCQCDSMCLYYGSCCPDFDQMCPKKTARGDTFEEAEEDRSTLETPVDVLAPSAAPFSSSAPPLTSSAPPLTSERPEPPPAAPPADRDAAACSARPFDAFLQLKNGSVYAFRGHYFFELDDKAVLPGYPKRIEDVWGVTGPVDAAFTRINCQGKSYIFQGRKYWRFDGDVLDEGFPRDISEGFDGIPDDLHAAFAVPAPNHRQKEKAYFFKGDRYHVYEFVNQPSHHECVQMSRSSPSLLFSRYTDLFCDQSLDDLFGALFGAAGGRQSSGPRLISGDWAGLSPPVDAAMVGRVFLSPKPAPPKPPPFAGRRNPRRWRKPSRKFRRRQSRQTLFDDFWSDLFDDGETSREDVATAAPLRGQTSAGAPVQYVYFFKRDKYYRVDLRSKRVAPATPPYPRSVAEYWLGCPQEDAPDAPRAERR